jgi:hypothetical protein
VTESKRRDLKVLDEHITRRVAIIATILWQAILVIIILDSYQLLPNPWVPDRLDDGIKHSPGPFQS